MATSKQIPERPVCDVTDRLEKISRIQVYAKRERDALERRAREEGGVVRGGVVVPRNH